MLWKVPKFPFLPFSLIQVVKVLSTLCKFCPIWKYLIQFWTSFIQFGQLLFILNIFDPIRTDQIDLPIKIGKGCCKNERMTKLGLRDNYLSSKNYTKTKLFQTFLTFTTSVRSSQFDWQSSGVVEPTGCSNIKCKNNFYIMVRKLVKYLKLRYFYDPWWCSIHPTLSLGVIHKLHLHQVNFTE